LDWDVGRDRKEAAAQAAGGAEGKLSLELICNAYF
jgi:hypothetical protein